MDDRTTGKRITIREVAQAAGVSVATVSRVLNGNKYVSEDVLESVRRVIAETGYRPSRLAQTFARGSSRTVTLLYDALDPVSDSGVWSMFATILSLGLHDVLSQADYQLRILHIPPQLHSLQEEDIHSWMIDDARMAEGDPLIITNPLAADSLLGFIVQRRHPCVVIGKCASPLALPQIDPDNLEGARLATAHLIELGHTDIAFLCPPVPHTVVQDRYQGFLEAIQLTGGLRVRAWRMETRPSGFAFSYESARQRVHEAILQKQLPTAIVAFNDEMAFGAIQALHAQGMRIPEDISVTGFDDMPPARMYTPPLTTVRQDIRQLGQHAARSLLRQVQGYPGNSLTLLPVSLVIRDSTSPPGAE